MVGNKSTISTQLHKAGTQLFGKKFVGVFASNRIPSKRGYMIINLDSSKMPGSHWIAMADDWVYDSFGRPTQQILGWKAKDTEYDAEQLPKETNCGARVLAWLMVYDQYGPQIAKWV